MRILKIISPALVAVALVAAPVGSAAAAGGPVGCSGTGSFGPSTSPTVRVTPAGEMFVAFTFVGLHPYCSAPGGVDDETGTLAGTMSEHITAGGQFDLTFLETMTLEDGSSDQWRGSATGSVAPSGLPTVSASEVRTVGTGTGQLAGVEGHGSFEITGFGGAGLTFADTIFYSYPA